MSSKFSSTICTGENTTQHPKLIRSVTCFALSSRVRGKGKARASSTWIVDPPIGLRKRFRADSRRRSKRAPTTIIDSTSRETFRHHAYRRYRSVRRLSRQPRPRDQLIEQAREIEFTQLIRGARAHALSLSNTLTTHFCAVLRHRFLPRTPSLPSPPLLPLVLVPVGEIGTTERGNGFLRPHKIRKFIVTVPANLFPLTTIPPPSPLNLPPLSTCPTLGPFRGDHAIPSSEEELSQLYPPTSAKNLSKLLNR